MGYSVLSEPNPAQLFDRIAAIEALLGAGAGGSAVGTQFGTHYYTAGYVPPTLTSGTDTAGVANKIWVAEVRIDKNTLITGISWLIGATGGTDNVIAILYDRLGNVLATSALAGTLVGTLDTFQRLAFVTPYQAAPGLYYIGIQTNGVTATLRLQAGGDHNAGGITGQTFGTPTAITPPSTFTAATGPIAMTY
jgi:hypothetical protein